MTVLCVLCSASCFSCAVSPIRGQPALYCFDRQLAVSLQGRYPFFLAAGEYFSAVAEQFSDLRIQPPARVGFTLPTVFALFAFVGLLFHPSELSKLGDILFLALHGEYGEDGQIQRELGNVAHSLDGQRSQPQPAGYGQGRSKAMMPQYGFASPPIMVLDHEVTEQANVEEMYNRAIQTVSFPELSSGCQRVRPSACPSRGRRGGLKGLSKMR